MRRTLEYVARLALWLFALVGFVTLAFLVLGYDVAPRDRICP